MSDHNNSRDYYILKQFMRHRLAVVGSTIILGLILLSLLTPFISYFLSVTHLDQNVFFRYQPIYSKAQMSKDQQEVSLENFLEENIQRSAVLEKAFLTTPMGKAIEPGEDFLFDLVANHSSKEILREMKLISKSKSSLALKEFESLLKGFSKIHLLGTDELGRDVFMRLIYGTRVSIGVGFIVAVSATVMGLIVGFLSGFYGGLLDNILMRLTDALLSLPQIPILIVLAALDLKELPFFNLFINAQNESVSKMVVILCLFSWMTVARLVRASVLSAKEREYVMAARMLGATDFRIITRHIFPNIVGPLLVEESLIIGQAILVEAGLSFLGLGIQPPTPSWGNMLFNAQELIHEAPLLAVLPGLMILLAVMSFNFIGDGFRDAFDPKSIKNS